MSIEFCKEYKNHNVIPSVSHARARAHTHSRTRARARAHTHTHTDARARARAHTHTGVHTDMKTVCCCGKPEMLALDVNMESIFCCVLLLFHY